MIVTEATLHGVSKKGKPLTHTGLAYIYKDRSEFIFAYVGKGIWYRATFDVGGTSLEVSFTPTKGCGGGITVYLRK